MSIYSPYREFILRTPLFSIDEFHDLSANKDIPKEAINALKIGAPEFAEKIIKAGSNLGDLIFPLNNFLLRMSGRTLGYSIFSSLAVGKLADRTELILASRSQAEILCETDASIICDRNINLRIDSKFDESDILFLNPTLLVLGKRFFFYSIKKNEADLNYSQKAFQLTRLSKLAIELFDGPVEVRLAINHLKKKTRASSQLIKNFISSLLREQILLKQISFKGRAKIQKIKYGKLDNKFIPSDYVCHLNRDVVSCNLDHKTATEIGRGAELLIELFRGQIARFKDESKFGRLRRGFIHLYGEREMPFLEVIHRADRIMEYGKDQADKQNSQFGVTLTNLFVRNNSFQTGRLDLTEDDIQLLKSVDGAGTSTRIKMPNSISAVVQLLPNEKIFFNHILGPPAGRHFTRFALPDSKMANLCKNIHAEENRFYKNLVLADVKSVPSKLKAANVQAKSFYNALQIAVTGLEEKSKTSQVNLNDLMIFQRDGRLRLKSISRNIEVLPVVNDSYVARSDSNPVFSFLYEILNQDSFMIHGWLWPQLETLECKPRISHKNFIFSPATWRFSKLEVNKMRKLGLTDFLNQLRQFRIPRYISVREDDRLLPYDLDSMFQIKCLHEHFKFNQDIQLVESLQSVFDSNNTVVHGPEGRYVSDLIVPFFCKRPSLESHKKFFSYDTKSAQRLMTFEDGWVYLKLYLPAQDIDWLVHEWLIPFLKSKVAKGFVKKWFFVRYSDPTYHLRIRFDCTSKENSFQFLSEITKSLSKLIKSKSIEKYVVDGYDREIERYGGSKSLTQTEDLFYLDSVFCLQFISRIKSTKADRDQAKLVFAILMVEGLLKCFGVTENKAIHFLARDRHKFKESQYFKFFQQNRTHLKSKDGIIWQEDPELSLFIFDTIKKYTHTVNEKGIAGNINAQFDRDFDTSKYYKYLDSLFHMSINRLGLDVRKIEETFIYGMVRGLLMSHVAKAKET